MKTWFLLFSLLISNNVFGQGDPAPYIKGQWSTGLGNAGSTIFVPANQSTKINAYQALVETGNQNLLVNPGFEHAVYNTGWTCATGTPSLTTKAITPGSVFAGNKALKVVSIGAGVRCYQLLTSNADVMVGQQMNLRVRVKTDDPALQVCNLAGGTTSGFDFNCATVPVTFAGSPWASILVPFLGNGTSNGIVIKSATTTTQNIFIDDTHLGVGLGTTNFIGDTVYSAKVSGTGVVTMENKDWINGNCTPTGNAFSCPLVSGLNTVPLNCVPQVENATAASRNANLDSYTATTVAYRTFDNGTAAPLAVYIVCQKQGADYASASSSAYSTTGNPITNSTDFSAAISGAGAVSGENLDFINGSCTVATTTVTCPYNANILTIAMNCQASVGNGGDGWIEFLTSTSTGFSYRARNDAGVLVVRDIALHCQKQGADYLNSFKPIIVGSFSGIGSIPGYVGRVDKFQVSYGATATTACTTGTCAYLSQQGNGAVSISVSGTTYTLTTTKSYSTFRCTINANSPGVSKGVGLINSTTATNVYTFTTGLTTDITTYGTLDCTGTY